MHGDVVLALYRPHPGCDAQLEEILTRHVRTLRDLGFATDRPVTLVRAADGTYLEIFEWVSGAAERAHAHPAVEELWGAMAAVASFPTLGELAEASQRFPHFRPADGVTI